MLSAGLFVLGFIAFPMPEIFPKHYWLFHSLWHVLLAAGYYELYSLIEFDSNTVYKKTRRQHVRAKQRTAKAVEQAINATDADANLPSKVCCHCCDMLHDTVVCHAVWSFVVFACLWSNAQDCLSMLHATAAAVTVQCLLGTPPRLLCNGLNSIIVSDVRLKIAPAGVLW